MLADDKIDVWVQESVVASALNLPVRPAYRRRACGGESEKENGLRNKYDDQYCPTKNYPWAKARILPSVSAPTYVPTHNQQHDSITALSPTYSPPNVTIRIIDSTSTFANETISLPSHPISILPAYTWSPSSPPPDDLIDLTHLHEPAIVECLRMRYSIDKIYTFTGPILIAVNPLREIEGLYGDDQQRLYMERGERKSKYNLRHAVQQQQQMQQRRPRLSPNNWNIFQETNNTPPPLKQQPIPSSSSTTTTTTNNTTQTKTTTTKLPPHIYAIADDAFRNMMHKYDDPKIDQEKENRERCGDQTILISGESGAGKTVTSQLAVSYLADLSRRAAAAADGCETTNNRQCNDGSSDSRSADLEQRAIRGNTILESFGNARTIRNDNSSRFGKFLSLTFSSSGRLTSSHVDTYLLEKVRLVMQSPGERNYHVFYELLDGCREEERKRLFLEGAGVETFVMTCLSGTFDRRDGVRDEERYREMRRAMMELGFDREEQLAILAVVAAILHVGNLTFEEIDDDRSRLDKRNPHLRPVLELLGVDGNTLNRALCHVQIETPRGEVLLKTLGVHCALNALEALIKCLYGSLFDLLVMRINEGISGRVEDDYYSQQSSLDATNTTQQHSCIGILDIFGFESLEGNNSSTTTTNNNNNSTTHNNNNSFEQLCINYCNEALQQQFNKFVFKLERLEYERENIPWTPIPFPDNQDALDLIDKKHTGILSILNEQCRLAKKTCSDRTFISNVYEKCGGHARFEASAMQMARGLFVVKHYAGYVEYDSHMFLKKNKNDLREDLVCLLRESKWEFVNRLAVIVERQRRPHSGGGSNNHHQVTDNTQQQQQHQKLKVSVGGQFSLQLRQLRQRISKTSPHYIRCLKPNDDLSPHRFHDAIVADQLRCGGMVEAVKVMRVGFPCRLDHREFMEKYGYPLGGKKWEHVRKERNGSIRKCELLIGLLIPKMERAMRSRNNTTNSNNNTTRLTKQQKEAQKKRNEESITSSIRIGKTKVFLRRWLLSIMDTLLASAVNRAATTINTLMRKYLSRCHYLLLKQRYREGKIALMLHFGETNYLIEKYKKKREHWERLRKINNREAEVMAAQQQQQQAAEMAMMAHHHHHHHQQQQQQVEMVSSMAYDESGGYHHHHRRGDSYHHHHRRGDSLNSVDGFRKEAVSGQERAAMFARMLK